MAFAERKNNPFHYYSMVSPSDACANISIYPSHLRVVTAPISSKSERCRSKSNPSKDNENIAA